MGIKSFIPSTAQYSRKHHVKYLHKKARGHDVLMLVEWADGTMSEIGADYHPEKDGWYVATNGLVFANVGEGIDPLNYYGVNVIKCHAQIGCPFSTEACIQAEYDEAGEFETVSEGGKTIKVRERKSQQHPAASENGSQNGEVATDGGGVVDREYDIRPPAGAVGHTFGLTQAKQRAPNAISSMDLRRAIEYGKQSERDNGKILKIAAMGAAAAVVIILGLLGFQWLLGQLGGGGGGGGGGTFMPGMLLLAPVTATARDRAVEFVFGRGTEADGDDA